MRNILAKTGFTTLIILFLFPLLQAQARVQVDCPAHSIQEALDAEEDGAIIEVFGSCTENITIDRNRITLRGVDGATLTAADSSRNTITIRGLNISISGFSSVSGGNNVIGVQRGAFADIRGITIENAAKFGIIVNGNAGARIQGNTIQNNGTIGINIRQSASADILSNIVTGNASRGIQVSAAVADIDDNIITDNGSDGIRVRRTAHIRLSDKPGFRQTNVIERNGGFGVRCQINSSIRVRTAQAFGTGADANTRGDSDLEASCVVSGTL